MDKEWTNLWDKHVWDHNVVREWKDVAREARDKKKTVHMGRLFGICVEKNAELKENDERRKCKYRVVFGGHAVIDQSWEAAVFQDLGSSPSSMSAGKFIDFYACIKGNAGQHANLSLGTMVLL